MQRTSKIGPLASQGAQALREEGVAGLCVRFFQWLGVYRHLIVSTVIDHHLRDPAGIPILCEPLDDDELDEYLTFRPDQTRFDVEARLKSGGLCHVARHEGRVVAACWTARERAWIDYVGCEILLADDTLYHYDEYVMPKFRGLRIPGAVADRRLTTQEQLGYAHGLATFWPENRAAIRRAEHRGNATVGTLQCFQLGPWRYIRARLKSNSSPPMFELAPQHRGLHRASRVRDLR